MAPLSSRSSPWNADFALSSGEKAVIVLDGRHRTFAAAQTDIDRLQVFVVTRSDAVLSY